MDGKELKRLSRAELLSLLIEVNQERERLEAELAEANQKLNERIILLEEAGSIAQAAMRLNGIFEQAQRTADQYLESVAALAGRQGVSPPEPERRVSEKNAAEPERETADETE